MSSPQLQEALNELSVEELEPLLDKDESELEAAIVDDEPVEEPVEDQPLADVDAEVVEEPTEEATEEAAEVDEDEPEELDMAARMEDFERRLAEESAKVEKARADAELWEVRSQQQASRVGNLMKKLESGESIEQDVGYGDRDADDPLVREVASLKAQREEERSQSNVLSAQQAEQEFLSGTEFSSFLDLAKKQSDEELDAVQRDYRQSLVERADEVKEAVSNASSKGVARVAQAALRAALADAKIKFFERQRTNAEAQRESRRADLNKRKADAASSSSTVAESGATKPKSVEDMSVEELEKLLDSGLGDI